MTEPMTSEELTEILEQHRLYLACDPKGVRANLNGTSLSNACLIEADLFGASLRGADLSEADLRRADLNRASFRRADLEGADLEGAKLRGADLSETNLSNACLIEADLFGASLRGADLRGVDLRGADLRNADLSEANLSNADLRNADLLGVNLKRADLRGANLDYSVLPLWCGSLSVHFDDRQLKQIAYHLVEAGLQSKNASPETKAELRKIIDFANGFHRVNECEIIIAEEGEDIIRRYYSNALNAEEGEENKSPERREKD